MSTLPTLVSERLALRPAILSDLPWFHQVWTDSLVCRYLWQGRAVDLAEAARTLETCLAHGEATGLGLWRVQLLDGRPIGFFGFWPRAEERKPDVFMGLLPEFWKHGYGTEAACLVFRHVFDNGLADEVVCSVEGENQESRRMARKIGLVFVNETGKPGASTRFYRLDANLLAAAGSHCSEETVDPVVA